ncbi:hypothetical protein F511_17946 [Dorcoceras hygrometricum]|uniref:Uncharacterized protein n=1 Tax=Dorcoceras hygrometricum TaxID=472368 RepID=A0A2Z7APT7_9LAMI|nr:hypothetical protein F511_17946 [Dorcoceras hygrometricum]
MLNENGKAGIGFSKPESFKPDWLKNRLEKDKAKASPKPSIHNQSRPNSKKVKSGWKKFQQRRDQHDHYIKPKLKRTALGRPKPATGFLSQRNISLQLVPDETSKHSVSTKSNDAASHTSANLLNYTNAMTGPLALTKTTSPSLNQTTAFCTRYRSLLLTDNTQQIPHKTLTF